eukprot:TRINITY_DN1290_c0_g1_i1.p1 TRINITY_DN1290_c0_g1~~TRINITY_DN1290_c0_g1_i1.p1  ORF type:complete len:532 (+),score=83.68 TRINITY_DN1290_c0_g1_i1:29-1624(+)
MAETDGIWLGAPTEGGPEAWASVDVTDAYSIRLGGPPAWMYDGCATSTSPLKAAAPPPHPSPACPSCRLPMTLALQAHAPLDVFDRVIYVFGCNSARHCNQWVAIRAQLHNPDYGEMRLDEPPTVVSAPVKPASTASAPSSSSSVSAVSPQQSLFDEWQVPTARRETFACPAVTAENDEWQVQGQGSKKKNKKGPAPAPAPAPAAAADDGWECVGGGKKKGKRRNRKKVTVTDEVEALGEREDGGDEDEHGKRTDEAETTGEVSQSALPADPEAETAAETAAVAEMTQSDPAQPTAPQPHVPQQKPAKPRAAPAASPVSVVQPRWLPAIPLDVFPEPEDDNEEEKRELEAIRRKFGKLEATLGGGLGGGEAGAEPEKYEKPSMEKALWKFLKVINRCPTQCLRWQPGGKPLLINSSAAYRPPLPLPRCQRCQGPRTFELQLLSTAIYYLKPGDHITGEIQAPAKGKGKGVKGVAEDHIFQAHHQQQSGGSQRPVELERGMSFGTVLVFTCARHCGTGDYVTEFAFMQPEPQ